MKRRIKVFLRRRYKTIILLPLLTIMLVYFLSAFYSKPFDYNTRSRDYVVEHGMDQVGSVNLVTGIYLDYRLFDSIFEASILFITVSGIAFMVKKDEDLQ